MALLRKAVSLYALRLLPPCCRCRRRRLEAGPSFRGKRGSKKRPGLAKTLRPHRAWSTRRALGYVGLETRVLRCRGSTIWREKMTDGTPCSVGGTVAQCHWEYSWRFTIVFVGVPTINSTKATRMLIGLHSLFCLKSVFAGDAHLELRKSGASEIFG